MRRWFPLLLLPAGGLGQHADRPCSWKAQHSLCGPPSRGKQVALQPSWGGYSPVHSLHTGAPEPSPHGYSPPFGCTPLVTLTEPGLTTHPDANNSVSARCREETTVAAAHAVESNPAFTVPPPYAYASAVDATASIDLDIPPSSSDSEAALAWSPGVYRKRKLQLDSPLCTHVAWNCTAAAACPGWVLGSNKGLAIARKLSLDGYSPAPFGCTHLAALINGASITAGMGRSARCGLDTVLKDRNATISCSKTATGEMLRSRSRSAQISGDSCHFTHQPRVRVLLLHSPWPRVLTATY